MNIADFASDVRAGLASHWGADVSFAGSFARGDFDQYSDVDLEARVHTPLDGGFYSELERFMRELHGQALVRYDPDYRGNFAAQDVRVSFYGLPPFWRVDLLVNSSRNAEQKWPSPFPEWSIGTSALMNVIWALKWRMRGDKEKAESYMQSAWAKVPGHPPAEASDGVASILAVLTMRADTDPMLLEQTKEVALAG